MQFYFILKFSSNKKGLAYSFNNTDLGSKDSVILTMLVCKLLNYRKLYNQSPKIMLQR